MTPFSGRRPRAVNEAGTMLWVSARTVSLTRTWPGPAMAQMRAAMLTAEPTKPSGVSTVSPAWIPTPTLIPGAPGWTASRAPWVIARPHSTAALTAGKTRKKPSPSVPISVPR